LQTYRNLIIAGRNGGSWSGTGNPGAINSSVAASSPVGDGIGYGLGSQIAPTPIGPFTINPTDTLLRYTLEGDANLDLAVDVSDLGMLASNWQGASTVWVQGDFNYDDTTDIGDLGLLASNWQQQLAASSAPSVSRAAPNAPRRASRLIDQVGELSRD
jgi:hypothetical protein